MANPTAIKVIRETGNASTSNTTWKSIIGSKAFRIGFEEVLSGKPFQYDTFNNKDAWNYERGRQFAAMGYDKPFKQGNRVFNGAIYSFDEAYRMKYIR